MKHRNGMRHRNIGLLGGWLPTSIANLFIWLAADRIGGLANADPVVTWADRSGNGRNFTQGTAANRPTFRTSVLNTLPIVRFDGTNDYLASAGTHTLDQPVTMFWVASRTGNTTAYNAGLTQATELMAIGFNNTVNNWYSYDGTTVRVQAAADNSFHYMTALFDGASSWMRSDGTQAAVSHGTTGISADTFDIGATNAAGAPLAGDIAEIIIYSAGLTGGQVTTVESYLTNKYGL